ncbi:MAG: hypothetical protein JXR25_06445 [Pontiellaceae bacterium]|nr:hypothetical protein [Pontiellaceae bacterium]MBN2784448.1 hypothetical protein [Pontiellaceae bacterium]
MHKTVSRTALIILLLGMYLAPRAFSAEAMIFFNGGMGNVGGLTTSQINGLRASGMTTMVIFTMSVDADGNFNSGGTICSNGEYVGPSEWRGLLDQCRAQPSSVTRIEMCLGGWGDPSWTNIKNRITADGTGSNTVLYRNLQALRNALGIDAICNDDESAYDATSTIQFGQMCAAVGMKSSLCPYTNPNYWVAVKNGLGDDCDRVYLQCYDGGAYNNPATWNSYFGGFKVIPGNWDWERDTTFLDTMNQGRSAGCPGGFLWPSNTGGNPPADANEMLQYGQWIQNTFNSISMPATAVETVGHEITFTASSFIGSGFSYQWKVIKAGVTNDIPGETDLSLTLTDLQLTDSASYLVCATSASETRYSSVSTLTVKSVPAPVGNVVKRYTAQTGLGYGFAHSPTWSLDSKNILAGQIPVVTNGDFSLEANWGTRYASMLTAGDTLTIDSGGSPVCPSANYVTCGNGSGAGSSVVYDLTTLSAGGYNLTNITVYGGWRDAGRDQQAFTVYYSTVDDPSSFVSLGYVSYNPPNPSGVHSVTRSELTPASGFLAMNVAALKFNFAAPVSENGWCGYAEITASGESVSPTLVVDTLPVTAVDVEGSAVTFIAEIGGSDLNYQWQKISDGITNDIVGATSPALTLDPLQLSDSAGYRVRAGNDYGEVYSTARSLVVNSAPAPVDNIVTRYAAQTGLGGSDNDFYTTWTVASGSLIAGMEPDSVGAGDFNDPNAQQCGTVAVLTDDRFGYLHSIPGDGSSPTEVTCGTGAGQSVTYALPTATYAYNLTNITVYGGWGDAGRDQQAYTVYYAQDADPDTFLPLGTADYNPSNPSDVHSATRTMFTAESGYLATNVVALKFDFTKPVPENGYTGYSEIQVFGTLNIPPAVPTSIGASMIGSGGMVMNIGDMVEGRRYEVQSSTNLVSGVWEVETSFVAPGASVSLTNDLDGVDQKFYRIDAY